MMNKYSATCFVWALVVIMTLGIGFIFKDMPATGLVGFFSAVIGLVITDMIFKSNVQEDQEKTETEKVSDEQ